MYDNGYKSLIAIDDEQKIPIFIRISFFGVSVFIDIPLFGGMKLDCFKHKKHNTLKYLTMCLNTLKEIRMHN
jgi:hypothetical protein